MGFIDDLQKRIEKNSVKVPNLTWTDGGGNVNSEDIYLKRSRIPLVGDWGRIYPPIDENGKVNWANLIFGGKQNFFKLLLIMIILALIFYQFTSLLGASHEYLNGENYVIIARPLFDKYCSRTTLMDEYQTFDGNLTVFKEMNNITT